MAKKRFIADPGAGISIFNKNVNISDGAAVEGLSPAEAVHELNEASAAANLNYAALISSKNIKEITAEIERWINNNPDGKWLELYSALLKKHDPPAYNRFKTSINQENEAIQCLDDLLNSHSEVSKLLDCRLKKGGLIKTDKDWRSWRDIKKGYAAPNAFMKGLAAYVNQARRG